MIPAPRLYPDELLCSGLVRCCRWFNLQFKVFTRKVVGLPQLRANLLSIWPLRSFEALYRVSAEHLLWNHTLFPYATGFVSGESYAMARLAALDGKPGMAHLLAVMQNASVGVSQRRVCLRCVQEDLATYGETFWHRSHHLPGVLMCAKHGCSLSFTELLAVGDLKTVYKLPIECTTVAPPQFAHSSALLDLARRSVRLLNRPDEEGSIRDAAWYRQHAIGAGLLSADRQVSSQALADAVGGSFSKDFLAAAGLPFLGEPTWPGLSFRPAAAFNFSTVKHLMLETALSRQAGKPKVLDHISSGPPGTAADVVDAFYAPLARQELLEVLGSGQVLTTAQFLRRVGALGPYRHRGAALPRLRKVVLEFRASPASVKPLRPGKVLFRSQPDQLVPSSPSLH